MTPYIVDGWSATSSGVGSGNGPLGGGPNTAIDDVKIRRATLALRAASSTFHVPVWLTSYASRGSCSPRADKIAAR